MNRPINKNLGVSPYDPEFDPEYNYEQEIEQYDEACIERAESRKNDEL